MIEQRNVGEIAAYIDGAVLGDQSRFIRGVSTPEDAGPDDLVYVQDTGSVGLARNAGAALVPLAADVPPGVTAIKVRDPAKAMARVIEWLLPVRRAFDGISASAHVDPTAELGADVAIGPFTYVGAGVRIGDRTEVHPSSTVGADTVIGTDCVIHSGVHIYPGMSIGNRVILHSGVVIGADGFGYMQEPLPSGDTIGEPWRHRKIRQVGVVILEDDVEIGANTTIDRATLSATLVGRGTKIDNLVTIGHNVRIGRHTIIIGQAGISGSTALGDYVTIAGQAGLADHIEIGAHAVIGAQSGVTKDVPPGGVVLGSPAVEGHRAKKALTLIDSLPEFRKTLAAHERRLAALERPVSK
jgi:UDP-3-O-[3-hydroxymyristoyl] glucosamine N-acyltransferase